jgi:hypothetical protein
MREPGIIVGRGVDEFDHGRVARWLHDGSEGEAGIHLGRLDARMRRKV